MTENKIFHEDALSGLRGLAAVWVMIFHYWGMIGSPTTLKFGFVNLTPIITTGWIGVDVFFVLSGFLLTYPILAYRCQSFYGSVSLSHYFARRLWRILPAYYALLLFLTSLSVVHHYPLISARSLSLHAFMAHNLNEILSIDILPVFWSMPVEFDFYLVLPLLVYPLIRQWSISAYLLYAIAASLLFQFWTTRANGNLWLIHQLPARLQEFMGGMSAAAIMLTYKDRLMAVKEAIFSIGLLGLIGCIYLVAAYASDYEMFRGWIVYAFRPLVTCAIVALILSAALHARLAEILLANRVMLFFGAISYSLYLWHYVPIHGGYMAQVQAWLGASKGLAATIAIGASVVVAAISYRFIERPFLNRRTAISDGRIRPESIARNR